jgi:hypothetical protein
MSPARFLVRTCGITALLASACLFAYSLYAAWIGEVVLATQAGDVAVRLDLTPRSFFVGVAFYVAGAALFFWIGRGLLNRQA